MKGGGHDRRLSARWDDRGGLAARLGLGRCRLARHVTTLEASPFVAN